MEPATTVSPKIMAVRTDNPLLAAMSDEEFGLFISTAMLKHYRDEYGVKAITPGQYYWVVGTSEQIERVKQYDDDDNPRYYIEEGD